MTLNVFIFVRVVTTILEHLLTNKKVTHCRHQAHVDIELSKINNSYFIRVTDCGKNDGDAGKILDLLFKEFSPLIEFNSYFEIITASVRNTNGKQFAYDLRLEDHTWKICARLLETEESHRFERLDEFLSFEFQSKMLPEDIETFKEYLTRSLIGFAGGPKLDANYTFRFGDHVIYQSHNEMHRKTNCSIVASAIMKIVENSEKQEFRKRCFALLDVSSSYEIEKAVTSKISSLMPNHERGKSRIGQLTISNFYRMKTATNVNQEQEDSGVSFTSDNHQVNEEKENNHGNIMNSPIIMSSTGRRVKRTKFFDPSCSY